MPALNDVDNPHFVPVVGKILALSGKAENSFFIWFEFFVGKFTAAVHEFKIERFDQGIDLQMRDEFKLDLTQTV